MPVPQTSLHYLSLQLSLHGHSSLPDTSPPPVKLKCYIYALHMFLFLFYVTNISIINSKMPLIFNQALKFIPIESALNNNKRAIQVKEH